MPTQTNQVQKILSMNLEFEKKIKTLLALTECIIDRTDLVKKDVEDIKNKLDGVERMEVEPIVSIEKI